MREATSGYTNCEACDEPSMGALCEFCRLGALENNGDPDSIGSPDFDTQILAVWCASGEAIAEREQDEADAVMRTAFDAAVGAARDIRASTIADAEAAYAASLATAWSHVREPDARDTESADSDSVERNIDDQDERDRGFDRALWGAR